MFIGMGTNAAYFNGFFHGRNSVVSPWTCSLTYGSHERRAWMDGYKDGTKLANEPWAGSYPLDRPY